MTTDRPPVEDVIEDTVAGMDDDALAECIIDTGEEAERLTRMVGMARHELVQRMVGRDATVLDTANWEGKLMPGAPSHQIDEAVVLVGLADLLTGYELARVRVQPLAPPPRMDKRYLNELAKRGGPIRAAIEAATVTTRGAPRLRLKRKEVAE